MEQTSTFLSRFRRPRRALDAAWVDLRQDVVTPACAAAAMAIAASGMCLSGATCPNDVPIHGDARLLRKVVASLLWNAVKHGFPNGRIELAAGLGPSGLTVSVWSEARTFRFPPRPRCAAWFGVADPLEGCRRIVRLHGGAVWAKYEQGQWAEVWFTLPQPVAALPYTERKVSA